MNAIALPAFYDDLGLSFDKAWDIIEPGAGNRKSAAHTPVVGTTDGDGCPQLRVMVLRSADRRTRNLRFHTDIRSAKIAEIEQGASASVLMYDSDEKLQLRLGGTARLVGNGPDVDEAWAGSTPFARRCYMAEAAPGSPTGRPASGLPAWIEGRQPAEDELIEARENFAIIWFEVTSLEFLYLANAGHRRAKWIWNATQANWSGSWLIP